MSCTQVAQIGIAAGADGGHSTEWTSQHCCCGTQIAHCGVASDTQDTAHTVDVACCDVAGEHTLGCTQIAQVGIAAGTDGGYTTEWTSQHCCGGSQIARRDVASDTQDTAHTVDVASSDVAGEHCLSGSDVAQVGIAAGTDGGHSTEWTRQHCCCGSQITHISVAHCADISAGQVACHRNHATEHTCACAQIAQIGIACDTQDTTHTVDVAC